MRFEVEVGHTTNDDGDLVWDVTLTAPLDREYHYQDEKLGRAFAAAVHCACLDLTEEYVDFVEDDSEGDE